KALDKMSLHTSLHSTNAKEAQLNVKVGDTGTAMTRLALVGNAQINGNVVEVKSAGNFINPGTAIRVTEVNEAAITVEAIS
ncbi:MAG: NfeD family protein, partial [Prevotellamassilia sp.]